MSNNAPRSDKWTARRTPPAATCFMGICVGAAWALQIFGFGGEGSFARLLWVLASASIAGAGTGMIVAAGSLQAGAKA